MLALRDQYEQNNIGSGSMSRRGVGHETAIAANVINGIMSFQPQRLKRLFAAWAKGRDTCGLRKDVAEAWRNISHVLWLIHVGLQVSWKLREPRQTSDSGFEIFTPSS